MLSWIESWWNRGASFLTSTASRWIHVALHAIAGIIHTVFHDVAGAWTGFQHATWDVWSEVRQLSEWVYHGFWWVIRKGIPELYGWAVGELKRLEALALYYLHWALNEAHRLYGLALHYVDDVISWLRHNIIDPIGQSLSQAWDWITRRGETLWYYLTHPNKLMDLLLNELAGSLSRASDSVLESLGEWILALVLHNIKRFLHLVEDIVSAVL